ncbi:AGBL4, partial [Symbiodinium pilosum]
MVRWRDLLRSATENGLVVQGHSEPPAASPVPNGTDGGESLPEEPEDDDLPALVSHELDDIPRDQAYSERRDDQLVQEEPYARTEPGRKDCLEDVPCEDDEVVEEVAEEEEEESELVFDD